jgi:hypothetical protein
MSWMEVRLKPETVRAGERFQEVSKHGGGREGRG